MSISAFLEVTNTAGAIVIGIFALLMVGVIAFAAVLLAKGIQRQKRYNSTALPSLQVESEQMKQEEEEEGTVFDLSSVDDEFSDEGFESDKWFAQTHGIDEEEMEDIRRRRKSRTAQALEEQEKEEQEEMFAESDDFIGDSAKEDSAGGRRRSVSLPKL